MTKKDFSNYFYFIVKDRCKLRDYLRRIGFSTSFIRKVTLGELTEVNGRVSRTNTLLYQGDRIRIKIPDEESSVSPSAKPIDILFEDEDYLVVDKPYDMPTHPATGTGGDTLSNRVSAYFLSRGLKRKIRPVTRLDRLTTGIVIFAKHAPAQEHLQRLQQKNGFYKEYAAVVTGETPERGYIVNPLSWDGECLKGKSDLRGREAVTEYYTVKRSEGRALLSCILHTGRTHQIRIHLADAGCPILGDTLYGGKEARRLFLHCTKVGFTGFRHGEEIVITSPYPWNFPFFG